MPPSSILFDHLLITKFNLRFADWKGFKNSDAFGSDEWMDNRFDLFDRYCFPSVCGQTNLNFTWLMLMDHSTSGALWQQANRVSCRILGRLERGVNLFGRSHHYLLQALEQWHRENPAMARSVKVVLVGDRDPADEALVEQSAVRDLFEFTGYLPHLESLARVRAANLLFLPLYGLPPGRRASIVPGKTYEYMASGRPILAALPEGDARDFVSQAGNGFCCAPDDVGGMLHILKARYECWRRGEEAVPWQPDYVQRFERRELTRQLARLLDGVLASRGQSPAGQQLQEMALAGVASEAFPSRS